ncbi:putative DMT superfamily transporter inner membrane protein [Pseudovibrio axinellae]|uniref:Putative DMT superfamily transporter inner membrane protein n=1 Tax=Pseudovibrio axinellae TaxID=989403 RepID=A0A165UNN2_9HYPH|nr:DMT family transporter [Pseudovibrio axinellae]KZL12616.1 putative DMT superfamily transporter inner membrane protein [Pseudovibrio axinellae]SEP64337.1 Threonine/homoserine efflux transporter RhtA [Pseudovibrio axinellae]
MNTALLFMITVFIWGTSWLAVAWQIGEVPILTSIFYRFALAALLMFAGLLALKRLTLPAQWRYIVLQALCLFSVNIVAFYYATAYIPSGLVAVIFSLASILNAVNARFIYGDQIARRVVLAAFFGVTGLGFIFWQSLALSFDTDTLKGVGLAMLGTFLFSLGNMVSRKNTSLGISPATAIAWGMAIAAVFLLALMSVTGDQLVVPSKFSYVAALIYLALFSSVIGFTTYLVLVARIGSAKAGYATVVFPVVALLLSTFAEGFEWTIPAIVGVSLILVGNLVMFARAKDGSALRVLKRTGFPWTSTKVQLDQHTLR